MYFTFAWVNKNSASANSILHRQITFCIFAEGTKYRILEINIDTP